MNIAKWPLCTSTQPNIPMAMPGRRKNLEYGAQACRRARRKARQRERLESQGHKTYRRRCKERAAPAI
nr:hypothetical protein GCM10020185_86860 [Pseudomonas brassicacearum subsp. brassicacearum]